jgi:hypothetical protein
LIASAMIRACSSEIAARRRSICRRAIADRTVRCALPAHAVEDAAADAESPSRRAAAAK